MKHLTYDERRRIYLSLLSKSDTEKFRKITILDVSTIFSISTRTVSSICRHANQSSENGEVDVNHRRSENYVHKRIKTDRELF